MSRRQPTQPSSRFPPLVGKGGGNRDTISQASSRASEVSMVSEQPSMVSRYSNSVYSAEGGEDTMGGLVSQINENVMNILGTYRGVGNHTSAVAASKLYKKVQGDLQSIYNYHTQVAQSADELDFQSKQLTGQTQNLTGELTRIQKMLADVNFDDWNNASVLEESIRQLQITIEATDPRFCMSPTPRFYQCHPIQHLVALKFTRLEELVFVLKKKVVEGQTHGALNWVVDKYGSVDIMHDRIVALEAENAKFKLKELRFAHDPLLQKRPLETMDADFLRTLVLALQNELVSSQKIIAELTASFSHANILGESSELAESQQPVQPRLDVDEFFEAFSGRSKIEGVQYQERVETRRQLAEQLQTEQFKNVSLSKQLERARKELAIVKKEEQETIEKQNHVATETRREMLKTQIFASSSSPATAGGGQLSTTGSYALNQIAQASEAFSDLLSLHRQTSAEVVAGKQAVRESQALVAHLQDQLSVANKRNVIFSALMTALQLHFPVIKSYVPTHFGGKGLGAELRKAIEQGSDEREEGEQVSSTAAPVLQYSLITPAVAADGGGTRGGANHQGETVGMAMYRDCGASMRSRAYQAVLRGLTDLACTEPPFASIPLEFEPLMKRLFAMYSTSGYVSSAALVQQMVKDLKVVPALASLTTLVKLVKGTEAFAVSTCHNRVQRKIPWSEVTAPVLEDDYITQLDVGSCEHIACTTEKGDVYLWNGPSNGWIISDCEAGADMVAIGEDGDFWFLSQNRDAVYRKVRTPLTNDDGEEEDEEVTYSESWMQMPIPGDARWISVANSDNILLVDVTGTVYLWNNAAQNWQSLVAEEFLVFALASIGADGEIWALDTDACMYRRNAYNTGWILVPFNPSFIATAQSEEGVVSTSANPNFSAATEVAVSIHVANRGQVFVISQSGQLYRYIEALHSWQAICQKEDDVDNPGLVQSMDELPRIAPFDCVGVGGDGLVLGVCVDYNNQEGELRMFAAQFEQDLLDAVQLQEAWSKLPSSFPPPPLPVATEKEAKRNGVTPRVILAGAPASGKGTQCKFFADKYDVHHISTGDLLRAEVAANTEIGKKVKTIMEAGQLVPDDLMIEVVKRRLQQPDVETKGWLLDGFPCTGGQAQALQAASIEPNAVVVLNVADELLVERVEGRRMDPTNGEIYHMKFNPPPTGDAQLIQRLVQRSDDTREKMGTRLKVYHTHVSSIKEHYSPMLVHVEGDQDKEKVFLDICNAVEDHWLIAAEGQNEEDEAEKQQEKQSQQPVKEADEYGNELDADDLSDSTNSNDRDDVIKYTDFKRTIIAFGISIYSQPQFITMYQSTLSKVFCMCQNLQMSLQEKDAMATRAAQAAEDAKILQLRREEAKEKARALMFQPRLNWQTKEKVDADIAYTRLLEQEALARKERSLIDMLVVDVLQPLDKVLRVLFSFYSSTVEGKPSTAMSSFRGGLSQKLAQNTPQLLMTRRQFDGFAADWGWPVEYAGWLDVLFQSYKKTPQVVTKYDEDSEKDEDGEAEKVILLTFPDFKELIARTCMLNVLEAKQEPRLNAEQQAMIAGELAVGNQLLNEGKVSPYLSFAPAWEGNVAPRTCLCSPDQAKWNLTSLLEQHLTLSYLREQQVYSRLRSLPTNWLTNIPTDPNCPPPSLHVDPILPTPAHPIQAVSLAAISENAVQLVDQQFRVVMQDAVLVGKLKHVFLFYAHSVASLHNSKRMTGAEVSVFASDFNLVPHVVKGTELGVVCMAVLQRWGGRGESAVARESEREDEVGDLLAAEEESYGDSETGSLSFPMFVRVLMMLALRIPIEINLEAPAPHTIPASSVVAAFFQYLNVTALGLPQLQALLESFRHRFAAIDDEEEEELVDASIEDANDVRVSERIADLFAFYRPFFHQVFAKYGGNHHRKKHKKHHKKHSEQERQELDKALHQHKKDCDNMTINEPELLSFLLDVGIIPTFLSPAVLNQAVRLVSANKQVQKGGHLNYFQFGECMQYLALLLNADSVLVNSKQGKVQLFIDQIDLLRQQMQDSTSVSD